MAQPNSENRNKILTAAGGAVLVLVIALLVVQGGHENGRPSAPSGPGNPMQTDQGR